MLKASNFSVSPDKTRGRVYKTTKDKFRNDYQRDVGRVIHSTAFRRLKYKTQVFVNHEGDHFRTRLTHTLEVSQIARSISRYFKLNEDLTEAIALAHDLGHTPFGHAGEDALIKASGSYFNHNDQSFRIVTFLEKVYLPFDGLNLTWETLEGIVKHNGPVSTANGPVQLYNDNHDLELVTFPGPEAQVAALADDIAYSNHDIDDALRAGFIGLNDLCDVPLVGSMISEVRLLYPGAPPARQGHETIRRVINRMVSDLVSETQRRVTKLKPKSAQEVRDQDMPVVSFSESMQEHNLILQKFLFDNMYRHYRVVRMASKARRVVSDLFELFIHEPNCLPTEWSERCEGAGYPSTARLVADYVAGMTDRYALEEYAKMFDVKVQI